MAIDNHSHFWRHCTGSFLTDPHAVYVCVCYGVTERQIHETAQAGCRSIAELTMRTGAGANCGSCLELAAELIEQVHGPKVVPLPLPVLSNAA